MSQERHRQLEMRAIELNTALGLLMSALQHHVDVLDTRRQDPLVEELPLKEQRDQWARELDVLRDQVPTLERLASGGVRPGRVADALIYIDQLAQAFLLAANDLQARAQHSLSPLMIERLPAWEVDAARAAVADTEGATARLHRVLDRSP